MSKKELTREDYRALAELRYQIRRFLHFSEQAARSNELNPQQHQLLLALKGIQIGIKPTISAVAMRLHIRHHSAVELTDRLTDRGLIRKVVDRLDRRCTLLKITARGEAVLRKLSVIHRAQLETVGKELIRALHHILEHSDVQKKRSRQNNLKRTR